MLLDLIRVNASIGAIGSWTDRKLVCFGTGQRLLLAGDWQSGSLALCSVTAVGGLQLPGF